MDRCIGQNVLCVGNVRQTIVDCFVLEAFREYRDDLRDHVSENTQNRQKSEITSSLKGGGGGGGGGGRGGGGGGGGGGNLWISCPPY